MSKLIYGAVKLITDESELPARLTSVNGKTKPIKGTKFRFDGTVEMEPVQTGGKPYFATQCTNIESGISFNLSINETKGIFFKFGEKQPTSIENSVFDNTLSYFQYVKKHVSDQTVFEITDPKEFNGTDYESKTLSKMEMCTYKVTE